MIDLIELYERWWAGWSQSEISAGLGIDPKTIRKYLVPAVEAGLVPAGLSPHPEPPPQPASRSAHIIKIINSSRALCEQPQILGIGPGPVGIGVFAVAGSVFNAVGEELLWRALVPRLVGAQRSAVISIVIPGISFGTAHFFGLPPGWWGMVAAAIYGTGLSALHRRHGLVTCVIAHFLTDVILFSWVLRWALFSGPS